MPRSDLPFGSEFSPAQIDLPVLLELAHRHGADWKAFEQAVRDRHFARHSTSDYNKARGREGPTLTEVGEALHDARHEEAVMTRPTSTGCLGPASCGRGTRAADCWRTAGRKRPPKAKPVPAADPREAKAGPGTSTNSSSIPPCQTRDDRQRTSVAARPTRRLRR